MELTEEQLKNMSPEQLAALQKQNCIFCHIVAGQVPAKKVYEDDKIVAVLDINPASKGHLLVFPKEHYQIMPQLPETDLKYMFMVVKQLSRALLKAANVKGTSVFIANGAVAGQKAPHFLVHIIPRTEKDNVPMQIQKNAMSEAQLKQVLAHLTKGKSNEVEAEIVEEKEGRAEDEETQSNEEKTKSAMDDEERIPEPKTHSSQPKSDITVDDIARMFGG